MWFKGLVKLLLLIDSKWWGQDYKIKMLNFNNNNIMIPWVKESDKWEQKKELIIKERSMYSKLRDYNIETQIKLIIKIMKKRDSKNLVKKKTKGGNKNMTLKTTTMRIKTKNSKIWQIVKTKMIFRKIDKYIYSK